MNVMAIRLKNRLIAVSLSLVVMGCAQTPPLLEKVDRMDTERLQMEQVGGSGQSTDWGLYMDMQGGGR